MAATMPKRVALCLALQLCHGLGRASASAPAAATPGRDALEQHRSKYHWPSGTEAVGGTDPDQDCEVVRALLGRLE